MDTLIWFKNYKLCLIFLKKYVFSLFAYGIVHSMWSKKLGLNGITCSEVKVEVEFSLGSERAGTDRRPLTFVMISSKYKHVTIVHRRTGFINLSLILERKSIQHAISWLKHKKRIIILNYIHNDIKSNFWYPLFSKTLLEIIER